MSERGQRWILRLALGCFVVAGMTGLVFRFALANVWGPAQLGGLILGNIRHAHSHLMFFGWATPVLMLLLIRSRASLGDPIPRGVVPVLAAVIGLGLLAFLPFLFWGYGLAPIAGRELPLGMITSGLNVIGWYAFAVLYVRMPRSRGPRSPQRLADVAVALMVLSTLPAWALAASVPMGLSDPIASRALVHAFLDTFSEGWFVVGALAVVAMRVRPHSAMPRAVPLALLLTIPLMFPLSLPAEAVSGIVRLASGLAAGLAGAATLYLVVWLWNSTTGFVLRLALLMLAAKAGAQVIAGLVPGIDWASMHGLRILYLHLGLLGFVSVVLVAFALPASRARAFAGSIGLLILALLPLTSAWPAVWSGDWVYHFAAWASVPAVLVGAWLAIDSDAPAD